jgi:small subunit ribosomal protein S16
MAIVIRLSRQGRRNRPHYRVGVFDRRTRRDGPPIEYLGHYDPREADETKKVVLQADRISHWLGEGALVSETVRSFLRKQGIPMPSHRAGVRAKRKRKSARAKA